MKNEFNFNEAEKIWWFRDNDQQNYRKPIMFSDNEGHITEYLYIKITKQINIMVDKHFKPTLKNHKIFLKNNELYYTQDKYLLELLFPQHKRENIRFKNSYMYDLRECNIVVVP